MASELKPCGGCGATSDRERCIGCLHDFGTPESAWVRPTPVAPVSPDATGEPWPYQKTFNAIAAATRLEGGCIFISVKDFVKAFGPTPDASGKLANLEELLARLDAGLEYEGCMETDGAPVELFDIEAAQDLFADAAAAIRELASHPAPDATGKCGELETVGYVTPGWLDKHCSAHTISAQQTPAWTEAVVTRSQAEELLAAEVRRERDLAAKQLSEVVDRMSDDYLALKAELDQAVGVIEDRSSEYEALEAKLAAAEKALEPFVSFFNEAMKGFTEGYAERTPSDKPVLGWNNAYLLMQHFIEARATLGGKPS